MTGAQDGTDDLSSLSPMQCRGVEHWVKFYQNHATYRLLGAHAGRFYDAKGMPTKAHAAFRECVAEGDRLIDAARRRVEEAVKCEKVPTPTPEGSFGTWHAWTCPRDHRPRRMRLPDTPDACRCLPAAEAAPGEDPADEIAPSLYRNCDEGASSCAVQTAHQKPRRAQQAAE